MRADFLMQTIYQLREQKLQTLRQRLLRGRKPYTHKEEIPAKSNDFIFDRETLTITKKVDIQLKLL